MERIIYEDAARNFAKIWRRDVSDHIIYIMASVMMVRDGVLNNGGSFVDAIINNDLFGAISRGDEDVLNELKLITLTKRDAYVNNLIRMRDYENLK